MTNWDKYKGNGPWDFEPIDFEGGGLWDIGEAVRKLKYNEGNIIKGYSDFVWSTDRTGVPITPTHNPCGYWWNDPKQRPTPPFVPWRMGYHYVTFPLSTYVTNLWSPTTGVLAGDLMAPTVDNGKYYKASVGGTTGSDEPSLPTGFGETVVDGSVTWECYGYRTLVSDYMSENRTPNISEAKLFGDYILTLSSDDVLECWSGGIPDLYGKVNLVENITLEWRQHVRTFEDLHRDEYLGLITDPRGQYIFLDTEDGRNGDGINWLNANGEFVKYTRLRTKDQIGSRLQGSVDFCLSRGGVLWTEWSELIIRSLVYYGSNTVSTVTYNYDPIGDDFNSLVILNDDGSVTVLDQAIGWTEDLHGGTNYPASKITEVYGGYLLVGPTYNRRYQYILCEPDTINPKEYLTR